MAALIIREGFRTWSRRRKLAHNSCVTCARCKGDVGLQKLRDALLPDSTMFKDNNSNIPLLRYLIYSNICDSDLSASPLFGK
jgi:hypothetical protein